MELNGKTAIVTGAGRGIGRALAVAFGKAGMHVICSARSRDQIESSAAIIRGQGGSAVAVPADVTSAKEMQELTRQTLDAFGAIDVLFNNAGSFQALGGMWEVDPELWWQDVTVNLRGTMLCSRAVLPHMMQRQGGVIINMRGGDQIPGGRGYSCSKVAVTRLTELMAKEQEREKTGVIVFSMGPGFVHTEMTDYQIRHPLGQKWLPSSQEAVSSGKDKAPELCAETALQVLRNLCPEINGKTFSAGQNVAAIIAALSR